MQQTSYWKSAFSLVQKTIMFLGINAVVYGVFFIASLIWFAIWGGLAYLFATWNIGLVAMICIVIGFAAWGGLVKFARRYVLYMVKGAHIAAMTEMYRDGQLPEGKSQFAYGRSVVEERFKEVSVLFGIDTLVHGILKAMSRRIIRIGNWLPLPDGADQLLRILTEILNRSLTYVDEAILSYAIHRGEENVWASARHGVLLYAQSYKPILKTAAKVWVLGKVVGIVAFAVFMIPAIGLMLLVNTLVVQVIGVVLAIVAAWAVKQAFFEPFALAYVLVSYHESIRGVEPDPEWDARLRDVSDKYRELVDKAKEAGSRALEPARQKVAGSDRAATAE